MAKKSFLNRIKINGRIYSHDLQLRETGAASKNPGTPYIGGKLEVATDDQCLNVVTVNFTYVTPTYSSGKENRTFGVLKNIIESGKTVFADGKDAATLVAVDGSLELNDFVNREGEMVSAKRNGGSFVNIVSPEKFEAENKFEVDMLINGTRFVEADPERHIDNDYLVVKGAIFDFRNTMLPVEFVVKNSGGISYFESLDASPSNLVFTKVWGSVLSQTIKDVRTEASAFGEASVKTYERTVKEWVVTGCSEIPYDMDDENEGITTEQIKEAQQAREMHLADVKKRDEEYRASRAAAPQAASAPVTAAQGAFNF